MTDQTGMGASPIRVLHWCWLRNAAGIDRLVKDLVHEQARNPALAVAVVTGRIRGTHQDDANLHVLHFGHGFDFRRLPRLKRLLAETDVLHMHAYNPVVALAARLTGVPVVYTDHGTDRARHVRNLLLVWGMQRRFVRTRCAVVTVNSRYRQAIQARFYRREPRLVYNGLDFSILRPPANADTVRAALGIDPGEFVVGTASLFGERKRIPLMVDLFHGFAAANPSVRARLLLVGDGYARHEVEARIAATGVGDRVVLTGFRDDARELMAAMDVFVQPARDEPFGLAAVEAMALERPVLVFRDGGGLTEIVRDGETGFVARDAADAVGRLERLWSDPRFARRVGQRARADVRERFDIAAMERALRGCYDEALASPRNQRRNQRSSQSRSAFAK